MLAAAWLALTMTALEAHARLVAPLDVVVQWSDPDGRAAGYVVEYINEPGDEWIILGFFPPTRKTYQHLRLAPHTPYQYRVRPFFGPASPPTTVRVAEGLSDQAYARAYALPEDYSWASPRRRRGEHSARERPRSIHDPATAAQAAPGPLKARLVRSTVSGFELTWTDRSSDEEGFLLERVIDPETFVVCATVDPDIDSFGWALEPPAREATFRVRAFHFGAASSTVALTTGSDPAGASDHGR